MSGQAAGSAGWNKVYTGPTASHSICMLEGGGKEKVNIHIAPSVPLAEGSPWHHGAADSHLSGYLLSSRFLIPALA